MLVSPELFIIKKPKNKELDIYENTNLEDIFIEEIDTDFHNIKIVKNKIGKFLMFNETYQAGFIDTSFYKGNLPYINYFLLSYILNPKIKKILLIGMGSGKVINDFEKLMPDLKKIDIIDIDPAVFQTAQKHFNFKKSEKTHFYVQDGRVFLRNIRTKYDLIIVDVAGNEGIPFRYMTEEFLQEAKKKLSPKGVLISNMFSSAEFTSSKNIILKSFVNTFQKNFKNVGIFKADYSDKIFYKTFFNYDKRIIDI
ncbi:MAG: fused MFS/spermidine synthase, partial [Candidatus Gastranaerophilaceae bacterium]